MVKAISALVAGVFRSGRSSFDTDVPFLDTPVQIINLGDLS